jgi:DNA-binding NtrC family response regulator
MDRSKVRILVVDDEEDILDALQTHLEMEGYSVEIAASAHEALARIAERAFHIILTDINMPKMDGIELLVKIKESRGDTIVIMITAYTSLMKVLNSRYHGAADYILKPFRDLTELDEVMARAYDQIERWDKVMSETMKVKKEKV